MYHSLARDSTDLGGDGYEYDSRLAAVGLATHPALAQPSPFWTSLIVVRFLPVILAASWLLTLFSLFSAYLYLPTPSQLISPPYISPLPFISDLGGAQHFTHNFFIAGCSTTALFYFLTLCAERWMRSWRVASEAKDEKLLWVAIGVLDVVSGGLASIALVLLSVFDVQNHEELHVAMLTFFVVAVGVSGLLQTAEVNHLWHEHPDRPALKAATVMKAFFLGIATLTAVSSWGMYFVCRAEALTNVACYRVVGISAGLQWTSAYLLTGYFATLILDVWPATRHRPILHRALATATPDGCGLQAVYLARPMEEYPARGGAGMLMKEKSGGDGERGGVSGDWVRGERCGSDSVMNSGLGTGK